MIDTISYRLTNSAASRLKHFADLADKRAITLALERLNISGAAEIPTWTTRAQLETLYRLAAALPPKAKVVEFGSYLGASTCFLAAGVAPGEGKIIAIDLWNNETIPDDVRDTFADFQRNIAGVAHLVKIVRKNTAELIPDDVEPPVDLTFIDADHSYEATRKDAGFIAPLTSADGIIAFHDSTTFAGVGKTVGELLATGEWSVGGHVESLTWIRRARWSKWPPADDYRKPSGYRDGVAAA
jgi:predicted O-methyltransferase YrrM